MLASRSLHQSSHPGCGVGASRDAERGRVAGGSRLHPTLKHVGELQNEP